MYKIKLPANFTPEPDNTVFILAGDNGLAVGCHGLMGEMHNLADDGRYVDVRQQRLQTRSRASLYSSTILPTRRMRSMSPVEDISSEMPRIR